MLSGRVSGPVLRLVQLWQEYVDAKDMSVKTASGNQARSLAKIDKAWAFAKNYKPKR